MPPALILSFGPFQLDAANAQLWCETQPVRLTAKALQVLSYLAERPGQLVTKDELFAAVWPDTVVSDATLTSNIQAVRQVLGDDSRSPQYIETVHRRGFRFIASVAASTGTVPSSEFQIPSQEEVVRSKEPEFRIQKSEVRSQEEDNHNPVLSPSTLLRINSVEGATGNDSLESSVQSLESENQNSPLLSAQSLDARRQTLDVSARSRFPRSLVVAAVLLLSATILTVQYLSRPSLSTQSSVLVTEEAKPPSLPLPDKPSLIVLPFANLSGDPTQEYFSDGVTADITSTLSRLSNLFVISRTSAFTYKDKPTKLKEISREMGVQYVLEGSVRKTAEHLRITVALMDATTDHPLWSEQYDRPFQNLFAVQDEIVHKIVTTLRLQLTLMEQGVIVRKRTDNMEAYDYFLRGLHYDFFTKEGLLQARRMLENAIELDPRYAEAYVPLAGTYYMEWGWHWNADPQTLERALALAQQAMALDNSLPAAHVQLGVVYAQKQQYDQAVAEGELAIVLDPNDANSYVSQAEVLNLAGRPEEALRRAEQAMRLNPHYPDWYLIEVGWAYQLMGRYEEAIATLKTLLQRNPNFLSAYLYLALSYLAQWGFQLSADPQLLERALEAAQRAVALSDSWSATHLILGSVYLSQKQYDHALAEMERGVALDPNVADGYAGLAVVFSHMGRPQDALGAAEQALRLKPSVVDVHLFAVGAAYVVAGRPELALPLLQRSVGRYPNILGAHLALASVYSELGQEAEARAEAAEVLRINPKFSLEVHRQRAPVKDPAVVERGIAAVRKAGLK